jgi:L-threonylcarbamoyladenylate synthase
MRPERLLLDGTRDGEAIARAAAALAAGEVVALPTESSYGLAVDALSEPALERLWAVKGRPEGKPPPILVADEAMLAHLVAAVPEAARALAAKFWPGPLTLALPARAGLPAAIVEAGFVGVRRSPHPVADALVRAFGGPITATSANRSGEPAALDAEGAALDGVALVLDGGRASGAPPSTVARVHADGRIEVLRAGPIDPTV